MTAKKKYYETPSGCLTETAVSVYERLALQAILGSDPAREMLSLAGIRAGKEQPIVLFRPKEETV